MKGFYLLLKCLILWCRVLSKLASTCKHVDVSHIEVCITQKWLQLSARIRLWWDGRIVKKHWVFCTYSPQRYQYSTWLRFRNTPILDKLQITAGWQHFTQIAEILISFARKLTRRNWNIYYTFVCVYMCVCVCVSMCMCVCWVEGAWLCVFMQNN